MWRWDYCHCHGPCRCGFGPHAYGFWRRAPALEELEATREWLRRELEYVENEIERLKGEKKKQES
ncbi:MAG: hypothetical protein DSO08_00380 [Candidatus Methanomethylicota archaeon]|jgi:hypothetical protein|uniref:DUF5320 domain-containing protein n=1 Tax=Thermoproteota archaeon TaxID=2056631 RepID=A0A523BGY7_9CREN|nr:MAG: hypothetical protein DSO08_00380 [Candidatus Verstraetearchaeota archaeon]